MYRKTLQRKSYESKVAKCAAMRAAKDRKRMESASGEWKLVRTLWLAIYAAPDGRNMELHVASERGQWRRCGSERSVRGALAKLLWSMNK